MLGNPRSSVAFAAVVTIAPFLFGFAIPFAGRSSFWVNDDLGNLLWLSGGFSGTPEFLNPVIGPEFGLLISTLYRITSSVPWYPIALVFFPALALAYLNLRLLRESRDWRTPLALVAISSILLLLLGSRPNYTVAAFVTSSAAVSSIIIALRQTTWKPREIVVPMALCLTGVSMRTTWPAHTLSLPHPFVFAALIGLLVASIAIPKPRRARFLALAVALVVPYSLHFTAQTAIVLANSGWRDFIEFHAARGAVSSVNTVDRYLATTPRSVVQVQTGLDELDLFLWNDWTLFDSQNPTTEELRRLYTAAQSYGTTIVETSGRAIDVAMGYASTTANLLMVLALVLALFSMLTGFIRPLRDVLKATAILVVPLFLVGYIGSTSRLPSYVALGISYSLLTYLILITATPERFRELHGRLRATTRGFAQLLAVTSAVLLSLPMVISETKAYPKTSLVARELRREYYEAPRAPQPLMSGVSDEGLLSLQWFPFDPVAPLDYLKSMDFSGGSNVRSPQYVRRWNHLTGSKDTTESLFNRTIWQRVLLPDGLARDVASFYWLHRGQCFAVSASAVPGYSQLSASSDCFPIVAVGQLLKDDSSVWYSTGTLNLYVERDVKNFSLLLLSPFGEFAQPHEVAVVVLDRDSDVLSSQRIVITPREGTRISFPVLQRFDRVLIESQSNCVIPFNLDPVRFPDQRVFCFGIALLEVEGERVPISNIVSPER